MRRVCGAYILLLVRHADEDDVRVLVLHLREVGNRRLARWAPRRPELRKGPVRLARGAWKDGIQQSVRRACGGRTSTT